MDKNRQPNEQSKVVVISLTVIIACVILGGFYYVVETNKQVSIEAQKAAEAQLERDQQSKEESLEKQEYIVKRKQDCYELHSQEKKNYNNVADTFSYDEVGDVCRIWYYAEKDAYADIDCNDYTSAVNYESLSLEAKQKLEARKYGCQNGLFLREY